MPWSAKAQELLKQQYAPVGVAAKQGLGSAVATLQQAKARGIDVSSLFSDHQERSQLVDKYINAYRQYCWKVDKIDDFKLAPFHILATEGEAHIHKPHSWHMSQIADFCDRDEVLQATNYRVVNLDSPTEKEAANSPGGWI